MRLSVTLLARIHLALMLLGLALLVPASTALAAERPNFIIFVADDMAWNDSGAYGHEKIRTPNIDQLARDGMRFDSAFLTCSSCSPSRCSILTGRYPHSTGAEQLHWPLPGKQVTFVELLKRAGYWTASAGKWHLGKSAEAKFNHVEPRGKTPWQNVIRTRPKDRPFFLWQAFSDPHRGYQKNTIPRPHTGADAIVPPYLPDVPETRDDLAMYYDEIARLDGVVGEVLAEVERQGETDNTLVLFISDNGRPFPRCKTTLLDSGIKTPFIVRYPKQVKRGTTSAAIVSTVDIAPTILELAGVKQVETFQGTSFLPLLAGKPTVKTRDYAFAEHHWHDYAAQERAVRGERFLYIKNYYPQYARTPPADAVRSPTYAAMQRMRDEGKLSADQMVCFAKPRIQEELYDVIADPHQLKNLAGDTSHAQTLVAMRQVLSQWQKSTKDAIPQVVTPDEFHRETGRPLKGKKNRSARPELRAGQRKR